MSDSTAIKFCHDMLKYYAIDPEVLQFNNGSFGAPPKSVLKYCQDLTDRIEAKPEKFIRLDYPPLLLDVRTKLAKFLNVDTDEVILVTNTSLGMTLLLRNIEWSSDDVIICFSTAHHTIARTAEYISNVKPHPTLSTFPLRFPTTHATILENFQKHLKSIKAKSTTGRVVAVIDAIISNPGYLLPWKQMVKMCREAGILTAVDGAHCIGQQQDIDLPNTQPDFWVSNCHKWFSTKRSVAVVYIPKRNQHLIKTSIPTARAYLPPSSGVNTLIAQHAWNGTIDTVPILSVAEALRFRESIGGEEAINSYCHKLAVEGGLLAAKIFSTRVLDESGEGTLNMTNVELPLRGSLKRTSQIERAFQTKLLVEHNTYVAVFYHNDHWWARFCAQIWNELQDFEKACGVLSQVCREIESEYGNAA